MVLVRAVIHRCGMVDSHPENTVRIIYVYNTDLFLIIHIVYKKYTYRVFRDAYTYRIGTGMGRFWDLYRSCDLTPT